MLTYSYGHLVCLAAAALSVLIAVRGHSVPLATDTHRVIADNN